MSKSHQGVIGQLAMLASTLGIQILQVPVFLTSVGPTEYGIYLTLVAIPSAVALADLGLLAASATRMMTLVAVGDLEEARRVSRAVSTVLLLVLGLVGATSLLIVPFVELPQLEAGQAASRVVLIVFVGYAILNVLTSGTEGIMRAGGHYPRAWIAMSLIRATEFLVASGIIFLTQNVITFALALLSSRLVATIWFAHYARRWTKWSDRRPSWRALTSIRSLFKPMVASIIQPLGNVLSIQGSVLVVSIILGPNAVVVYSTARTMFNAIRQGCMVFINAGMPGITVAQSTGRQSEAVRLWLKLLIMSAGLSGVGAVIVGVTAPLIITLWTGGKVAADPGLNWSLALLIVLDVVLTAGTLWLMGKNRHFPTAVALAGGTVVYLVLAVLTHPPSLADVSLIQCAVMVVIALVSASFVRRDMLNSKLS